MNLQPAICNLHALHIRLARQDDLRDLEWDGEYIHFRRLYAEAYRLSERGDTLMWLADLDSAGIVGQAFVSLRSGRAELSDGFSRAYVYAFRVKPSYRGQGVGTQIMATIETDLLRRGYQSVTLNVARDNAGARRLYERLGYQVVGSDPGRWTYIDHKGKQQQVVEPAWRMEKLLKG
jgi:ribosomal protein S18 acetylase RimI-like enzyme